MTGRRVRVEFTPKQAEVVIDALAMLEAEIEQNEVGQPGGRGKRELTAIDAAWSKVERARGRHA